MKTAPRNGGLKPPTKKKSSFKPPRLGVLAALCVLRASTSLGEPILVGSKKFTESYVLAEIAKRAVEEAGIPAEHRQGMGGTIILWEALRTGQIGLYPEYTGTIGEEILKAPSSSSAAEMRTLLENYGVGMTGDLGFNNTYALVMRRETAARLRIRTMSDLRKHSDLRFG